jgi:diadenosine tetraphosphatase ApaH/serine/threonine PP2A family protein phosphatase
MKYLILSDMHANWEALQAVLRHARRKRYDAILMLGDVVGYGAAPNQVVEAVAGLPGRFFAIRGNHDKVVAGIDGGENFNHAALEAARWTTSRLTPGNLRYVRELPRGPVEIEEGIVICHGSPLDEDAYVLSDFDAFEIFTGHRAWLTLFGHTHVTSRFTLAQGGVQVAALRGASGRLQLDPGERHLINPGSIGQPRDRDPRASYMVLDSDRRLVRWYRVPYPIGRAQQRIRAAGLPAVLAERLAVGM